MQKEGSQHGSGPTTTFAELIKELTAKMRDGQLPELSELEHQYPEHAEQLRLLHPSMCLLADLASSDDDASQPVIPGVLGDYRLLREIGRGGMGVVYEARQIRLDKRVAVKILPLASVLDPRRLKRFLNEARAAAQLEHPNIVPVHAVGYERGVHFYVMKLVDGRNLSEVIRSLRQTPPPASTKSTADADDALAEDDTATFFPQASRDTSDVLGLLSTKRSSNSPQYFSTLATLGIQAATALQHAHDSGVIHRDIKPSNIMLDIEGNLWVTDFGLAQVHGDPGVTATGDLIGTMRYMSPEQTLAKRVVVDHRTDIYSLGVTLYELLTTEQAFKGRARADIVRKIAFETPRLPRRINRRIPTELQTIVMKAIAKKPEDRYQSADDLAEDLRLFQENRPIRAKRPSISKRVRHFAYRHPRLSTIAYTAVAMLFLLSIGAAAWNWRLEGLASASLLEERSQRQRIQRLLRRSEGLRLAAHSSQIVDTDPGLALLLAVESARRHPGHAANNALLAALDANHEYKTLIGHDVPVGQAWFSIDGLRVITTASHGGDNAVAEPARVWDAHTGQLLHTLDDGTRITHAVVSPDGGRLLTTSNPYAPWESEYRGSDPSSLKPPVIWDLRLGKKERTLVDAVLPMPHTATFSSDGRKLVASAQGNVARVWDCVGGHLLFQLTGHTNRVLFSGFSPMGNQIVTVSLDRTMGVWDAESGELVRRIDASKDDRGQIVSAVFSPNGKWLLSSSHGSGSRLWEVETGRSVHAHQNATRAFFSADGSKIISYGLFGRTVNVHDVESGRRLATLKGHLDGITCTAQGPDGRLILTTSNDKTIRVWELESGDLVADLKGHRGSVLSASFSSDGRRIVSSSQDRTARIWDIKSGKQRATFTSQGNLYPPLASFSPDGKLVLVHTGFDVRTAIWSIDSTKPLSSLPGTADGPDTENNLLATRSGDAVHIWDAMSGQQRYYWRTAYDKCHVLRMSRDGSSALAIIQDGPCWIWNLRSQTRLALLGHQGRVYSGDLSPDGKTAATGCADGLARLWNIETGEALHQLNHSGSVLDSRFSSDGARLLTVTEANSACVWNVQSGQLITKITGHFNAARLNVKGTRVLTFHLSSNENVSIWESESGRLVGGLQDMGQRIRAAFHPQQPELVVASESKGIVLWNYETGRRRVITQDPSHLAAFSPDGLHLVTASSVNYTDPAFTRPDERTDDDTKSAVNIWNAQTGEHRTTIPSGDVVSARFLSDNRRITIESRRHGVAVFHALSTLPAVTLQGHGSRVSHATFSPDSKHILTTSRDRTAGLWDAATGQRLFVLAGHKQAVLFGAFSPDGETIATASADKTCILWNRSDGTAKATLTGHSDQVWFVSFRHDSERLLTISRDRTIRIWDRNGQLQRVLQAGEDMYVAAQFQPRGDGLLTVTGRPVQIVSNSLIHMSKPPKDEYEVRVYRSLGGSSITLPHKEPPIMGQFSPDGRHVITVVESGTSYIWDAKSGQELARRASRDWTRFATFSPDGQRVLTGHGNTVVVRDVNEGADLMTYAHEQPFHFGPLSIWPLYPSNDPFSADGRWVITVSKEGLVRKWPTDPLGAAVSQLPRELTDQEKDRYEVEAAE